MDIKHTRWAKEATEKAQTRMKWAAEAREKARTRNKWAQEAMEKARRSSNVVPVGVLMLMKELDS